MTPILEVRNIHKNYANHVALKDVSLVVEPKKIFGLLGPNGAGKSSLMRTIATLQEPDNGSISLGEINVLTQKDEKKYLSLICRHLLHNSNSLSLFGINLKASHQNFFGYLPDWLTVK